MLLASACLLQAQGPRRRALLVGIDNYAHLSADEQLQGAAPDAQWLRQILIARYGFAPADIVVLSDAEATHAAIVDNFEHLLIEKSQPGDVALFYFAGHGSTVTYTNGVTEPTLVPADSSRPPLGPNLDISTTELDGLLARLVRRTDNVTRILDSCHSDTGFRGGISRAIRPDSRKQQPPKLSVAPSEVAAVVRIAASELSEESTETVDHHGALSKYLFNELQTADAQTTWQDVMDRVQVEVTKAHHAQHPQLSVPEPATRIFGGVGTLAARFYMTVTPDRPILVNGGSIHGLNPGAALDVYGPKEVRFTGAPLAKLVVTKTNVDTSQAEFAPDSPITVYTKLEPGSRAVVRRNDPAFRFRLHVEDPALLKLIQGDPELSGAEFTSRAQADVSVVLRAGACHTEASNGMELSPPVPVSEAGSGAHILDQLEKWSEWHRLLNAEGDKPVLDIQVVDSNLRTVRQTADGGKVYLRVCLRTDAPRRYYISLVRFLSDGSTKIITLNTDNAPQDPGVCSGYASADLPLLRRKSASVIFKGFATEEKAHLSTEQGYAIRDQPMKGWSAAERAVEIRGN